MHGPIEAEISRSSKISPSTAGLYHRSVIRLTIWLPVFAWMAMIMWFSTGQWSAENTGSILRPLLHWLLPWATAAQIATLHALIRKTAHVTEYGVLATRETPVDRTATAPTSASTHGTTAPTAK
jgi:hypothetical protein